MQASMSPSSMTTAKALSAGESSGQLGQDLVFGRRSMTVPLSLGGVQKTTVFAQWSLW
ncbi:MAG: hypothetical protein KDD43_14790 [Bdellovibrionales bacterium]|nr:hypothetical protein [Bdellovibrionales bacterium]